MSVLLPNNGRSQWHYPERNVFSIVYTTYYQSYTVFCLFWNETCIFKAVMMKTYITYKSQMGGFTLIELMIVVAIIGLLAAIAIPNFQNYQCKARQSEAKYSLGIILTSQESYISEYDSYASSLVSISFSTKPGADYTYSIISASPSDFIAQANAVINNKPDVWEMNSDGRLDNTQPGCTN